TSGVSSAMTWGNQSQPSGLGNCRRRCVLLSDGGLSAFLLCRGRWWRGPLGILRFVHPVLGFLRHFVRSFLEFLGALTQAFGELRDSFRTEKNQNRNQHDDQLATAQTQDC